MNITIDILVIGAGGAGCRAAIAAADCGTSSGKQKALGGVRGHQLSGGGDGGI